MSNTNGNTPERIQGVRLKYNDLFWHQPNVYGVGEGLLQNDNGERTEALGIVVTVSKKVDQETLPATDRIPSSLEGVPVQIIQGPQLEPHSGQDMGHITLMTGLVIGTYWRTDDGIEELIGNGVISGIATRVSDRAKVIVTNAHVAVTKAQFNEGIVNPTPDRVVAYQPNKLHTA